MFRTIRYGLLVFLGVLVALSLGSTAAGATGKKVVPQPALSIAKVITATDPTSRADGVLGTLQISVGDATKTPPYKKGRVHWSWSVNGFHFTSKSVAFKFRHTGSFAIRVQGVVPATASSPRRLSSIVKRTINIASPILVNTSPIATAYVFPCDYCQLTGLDFSHANLQGANLDGADLSNSNLSNLDFTGSNLRFANLVNDDLTNAQLGGANLDGANVVDWTGTPRSIPTGWTVIPPDLYNGLRLAGPYVHFTDLNNVTLTGTNLTGATFQGSIANTSFTNANLTGASFRGVVFNPGASFDGSTLAGTDFTGATFKWLQSFGNVGVPVGLSSGWSILNGYFVGPTAYLAGANLTGMSFAGANLSNVNFAATNLTDVSFLSANLSSADFTGATFNNTDLGSADLTNAQFSSVVSGGITGTPAALPTGWSVTGGYLVGPDANLTGDDLTSTNLRGVDLTGATLTGANVDGVDLSATTLTGVVSGGITGTPAALPSGWSLVGGYLVGSGVDLSNVELQGANLTGDDLTSTNLQGANLTGATLNNVSLQGANLQSATLTNANLQGADLTDANLAPQPGPKNVPYVVTDLQGADLTNATLSSANLEYANLSSSNASGATLFRTNVQYANLQNVNFAGASLRNVNATNANVSNSDFSNADLSGATLTFTTFDGANFSSSAVSGISSGHTVGTPAALPSGWSLIDGYLVGPGANLENANLDGVDLSGLDLTDTDFYKASLFGSNLTNANLNGTNFTLTDLRGVVSGGITGTPINLPTGWALLAGLLVGPGVTIPSSLPCGTSLQGIDLADSIFDGSSVCADFTGADLTSARFFYLAGGSLNGSILDHAILKHAQLKLTTFNGVSAIGADFTNADLTGSTLTGANLIGADFSGATLTGANLDGVDLSATTLTGVVSGGITGTPAALPTGWSLVAGYLIGPGASLEYANFTNANLDGVDLSSFDLTGVVSGGITGTPAALPTGWSLVAGYLIGPGADLSHKDLTGMSFAGLNLGGVDFLGANLTNASFLNATVSSSVFYFANLTGTDFTGATFKKVYGFGITGTPAALPSGWSLVAGTLVSPTGG